jgi:hypothetical protein
VERMADKGISKILSRFNAAGKRDSVRFYEVEISSGKNGSKATLKMLFKFDVADTCQNILHLDPEQAVKCPNA